MRSFRKPSMLIHIGQTPVILKDMAVETPANVDGKGIHPIMTGSLPIAISAMINQQGVVHELLIQAYQEKSRGKNKSVLNDLLIP